MNRNNRQKSIFYINGNLSDKEKKRFFDMCKQFLADYVLVNIEGNEQQFKKAAVTSSLIVLGDEVRFRELVSKENLDWSRLSYCYQIDVRESLESEGFKHIQPKRMLIELISGIKNNIPPIMENDTSRFLEIDTDRITGHQNYPADLFLKLKTGKLIKVFNKGDAVDERLLKYKDKGVKDFLIRVDDFYAFDSATMNKLFDLEAFMKDPTSEYQRHMDTIYSVSRELGISEMVISNVEDIMGKFGESVESTKLKKLLDDFNSVPGTFMFKHSYLISLLCVSIVRKLDWSTEENLGKFCLAAMLHDLAYSDPNNALYETTGLTMDIPLEIRKEALTHAEKMAKKLEKNNEIHEDIIKMVRYHHFLDYTSEKDREVAAGRLNQHACLFIMVHNLVLELYKTMFDKKKIPALIEGVARQFENTIYKPLTITFKTEMNEILGAEKL